MFQLWSALTVWEYCVHMRADCGVPLVSFRRIYLYCFKSRLYNIKIIYSNNNNLRLVTFDYYDKAEILWWGVAWPLKANLRYQFRSRLTPHASLAIRSQVIAIHPIVTKRLGILPREHELHESYSFRKRLASNLTKEADYLPRSLQNNISNTNLEVMKGLLPPQPLPVVAAAGGRQQDSRRRDG